MSAQDEGSSTVADVSRKERRMTDGSRQELEARGPRRIRWKLQEGLHSRRRSGGEVRQGRRWPAWPQKAVEQGDGRAGGTRRGCGRQRAGRRYPAGLRRAANDEVEAGGARRICGRQRKGRRNPVGLLGAGRRPRRPDKVRKAADKCRGGGWRCRRRQRCPSNRDKMTGSKGSESGSPR